MMTTTIKHEELSPGLKVRVIGDPHREVYKVKRVTHTSAILVDRTGGMFSARADELEAV